MIQVLFLDNHLPRSSIDFAILFNARTFAAALYVMLCSLTVSCTSLNALVISLSSLSSTSFRSQ